eukprot:m.22862 g.22862  ORF g.22862 m.22862 type:complete len:82 (+) comp28412_c0_seq5:2819-3064(+)
MDCQGVKFIGCCSSSRSLWLLSSVLSVSTGALAVCVITWRQFVYFGRHVTDGICMMANAVVLDVEPSVLVNHWHHFLLSVS